MGTSVLSRRVGARYTALGVVGFAAAVALAAQIAMPVPGTPVPVTLQPMLVVLAGLWLGPAAGVASMLLYLAAGAVGLPAFTPLGAPGVARLLGPTGGYLIAYPAAAFAAGWLGRRGAPSLARNVVAAVAGMLVVHAGGLAQLTILSGSLERAVVLGTLPFAALDLVKAFVAALLGPRRMDRPAA